MLSLAGSTVLIVEDNEDFGEAISMVLEAQGAAVRLVRAAHVALEALKRDPFDLVITDIGLVDEDGLTLLTSLRKVEAMRELPVIVLSGRDDDVLRQRPYAAGCNGYLTRPLRGEALIELVSSTLERSRRRAESSLGPRS